jgi:pimeloyl-ACP methyl ester carboxylesterase
MRAGEDMKHSLALAAALIAASLGLSAQKMSEARKILSVDHTVTVKSIVPAIAGQSAQIYVRERVAEGLKNPPADRVVLFVHGAGTPAEVAFDVPAGDYSWMAYLAKAGFDAFSMDTTGYGRSTRPAPMNDPCNLSAEQQAQFIPSLIKAPCKATHPGQLTTIASDWNDIDAVVEHIRKLRKVEQVSLIAWSLGGPRAGGYTAQHPDKVNRLVILAPAYNRNAAVTQPPAAPNSVAFNTQSRGEFDANWDRQVGCDKQFDPKVRDAVWAEMLASDPVGAKWGTGVRRAPSTASWGWNAAMIGATKTPTLLIAGAHDKQVPPARVRDAYDDLGATDKVLIDLGCASHNAMWETNHLALFNASLEWLTSGTVSGKRNGVLQLGYPAAGSGRGVSVSSERPKA